MRAARRSMARARALSLAAAIAAACAAGCSVDPAENAAYRACSAQDDDCGVDAHCYRGYCVSDDGDPVERANSREALESPIRGRDAATAAGSASDGSPGMRAQGNAGSEAPAADAGASPPVSGPEPPSSSAPDQPPPPSEPPTDPPPVEPPSDDDPAPPPAAQCQPRPETCNHVDEDCDGRTDEGFALQTDVANCGGCGHECAAGESCCGGTCVDTSRTPAHCGECGHECTGLLQACCTGVCKTLCLL